MNKTKVKILEKSLELFNEYGVNNVSLRDIASEVGISVGNLQYHMKKRDDIIEELYFNCAEKVEKIFYFEDKSNLLNTFFSTATVLFKIYDQYKFILLNFSDIYGSNTVIKNHYDYELKKRELQYFEIIHSLVDNDIFREEIFKDEYSNLFKRLHLITRYWFSSDLIRKYHIFNDPIEDAAKILGQITYSYLTEKGRAQYLSIFPDYLI